MREPQRQMALGLPSAPLHPATINQIQAIATLTPPPFSPTHPLDDHAPLLHPDHHLVALDRFSGGAMAWVLTF